MFALTCLCVVLATSVGRIEMVRHDIDAFPSGYQVAVADVNHDSRPDVLALSTEADRVDWYENPSWQRRPVARTAKNIDLAPHDIDGDGQPELALAAGFYFNESNRGGEVFLLHAPHSGEELWTQQRILTDPVTHRVRWADLDGDGRKELVHAPLFGPGSQGARAPRPAHLWALQAPPQSTSEAAPIWKIDETLTVVHGVCVTDLDGDGRDELLTASFEGITRFDLEGPAAQQQWVKRPISPGARPVNAEPGTARGSSEVAVGRTTRSGRFLAAIEPWHGNQVVVYRSGDGEATWQRRVLDDSLSEGHALAVGDFDGDAQDEFAAGWRGAGGGLTLFQAADDPAEDFRAQPLDKDIAIEGLATADINGDGRLDLVAIAGRSNRLVWYENKTPKPAR